MVKKNDQVTVFRDSNTYTATVLGVEGELFWLMVPKLNEVQRGHLCNLLEHDGRKYLDASEWDSKIEHMFDASGEFISNAFLAVQNPKAMIDQLKMCRLIGVVK